MAYCMLCLLLLSVGVGSFSLWRSQHHDADVRCLPPPSPPAHTHTLHTRVPLKTGAEALIRHLAAAKVPLAVATSSHRRHFDVKTKQHQELFALFDAIITGDTVEKGKPHPDIFKKAAAAFAQPPASPAQVLVFEDAPTGVQAAQAAGMAAVMVPDPQLDTRLVEQLKPDAVLKSLTDFRPEQWGLPAFTLRN